MDIVPNEESESKKELKEKYQRLRSDIVYDGAIEDDDHSPGPKIEYLYIIYIKQFDMAKIGLTTLSKKKLLNRYGDIFGQVDKVGMYQIQNYFERSFLEKLFFRNFMGAGLRVYPRREMMKVTKDGQSYLDVYSRHLHFLATASTQLLYSFYVRHRSEEERTRWLLLQTLSLSYQAPHDVNNEYGDYEHVDYEYVADAIFEAMCAKRGFGGEDEDERRSELAVHKPSVAKVTTAASALVSKGRADEEDDSDDSDGISLASASEESI